MKARAALPFVVTLTLSVAVSATPAGACGGDCNQDGRVATDELVSGVRILLDQTSVDQCATMDANCDGQIAIEEMVAAVANALDGCPEPSSITVFNGEGNRLNAYDPNDNFLKQTVDHSRAEDPNGLDINGQVCFFPDGSRRFIAGEDTLQPNPPQGWGIFQLAGGAVGSLSLTKVGKLTPTYQATPDNAENYGCGFLSDGRALTTDVGDQAAGPSNGQLIVWFPPFDRPPEEQHYCKIDIAIGTAGGIYVDSQDRVYVTSARNEPGIYRYSGATFPTSDDAGGGCGRIDSTGAPRVDAGRVTKELFLPQDANIITPNAIVRTPQCGFYVSSVITGVIAEYDRNGQFVRRITQPMSGETLPYPSTGTPLGLGIDSYGTIYYADIGIVVGPDGVGPGDRTGTVRRIRFDQGTPLPPETMDTGLDFPDGIGVLEQ